MSRGWSQIGTQCSLRQAPTLECCFPVPGNFKDFEQRLEADEEVESIEELIGSEGELGPEIIASYSYMESFCKLGHVSGA